MAARRGFTAPAAPQLGHGASPAPLLFQASPAVPRGVSEVFSDPRWESAAQTLKAINIYGAKIAPAGRQRTAAAGRGGRDFEPLRLLLAGFGCCPAASSAHLRLRSPLRPQRSADSCSGSAPSPASPAGAAPAAALTESWEAESDPVMYSPGKVTWPCLITVLCLQTFHASLADVYLDFTRGLLISWLA